MTKLSVFVSSTCYDLSQVRADLSDFFFESGHTAILSEFDTFPVSPHKKTIDNCIDAVKNNADIFILIVGNRYGTTIDSGKSITNTEFDTARAKGIPIFIFVDKKTLSALSFWRDNPNADFTKHVDTTRIFDFISEIRDDKSLWTFEFEKAQDIVTVLKHQLSFLFKEALKTYSKYLRLDNELLLLGISSESINIILQKDKLYEFEFFSSVLNNEMQKVSQLRNDLKYNIHYEPLFFVKENIDILQWIQERTAIISRLIATLNNTINKAFVEFVNEPGLPSDLKGLFYVAKSYAKTFKSIVKWTIDTRNAVVPQDSEDVKNAVSMYSKNCLDQIWNFPIHFAEEIQKAKKTPEGEPIKLDLTLTIDIDPEAEKNFNVELKKFESLLLGK